jgi:hypothetical protein
MSYCLWMSIQPNAKDKKSLYQDIIANDNGGHITINQDIRKGSALKRQQIQRIQNFVLGEWILITVFCRHYVSFAQTKSEAQ